ncbi:hypothetical protein D3C86_1475960 [compost metagenome]
MGAVERLGETTDGPQHRRSAGRRRHAELLRQERPAADGRRPLSLQCPRARPAPDRRNPATTRASDLAGRSVGRGRQTPGSQGPRPVRRKLRRLSCTAHQPGRGTIRPAPENAPGGLHRHRPRRGQQHRRPPLRPDSAAMEAGRTGKTRCRAKTRRASGPEQDVRGQGTGLCHRLCPGPCVSRRQCHPCRAP